jgi:rhodanese-related sulfurtransferase
MTIDHALEAARSHLRRVDAAETAELLAASDALVVDTRPIEQRERDGEIPGALIIDRNVLEWRLDPASAHRVPEVTDYDQRIVVVCDEGYASSLAARSLQRIGLHNATDLAGGFQAWRAAGLPTR